jgi:hypothetical protein
MSSFIPTIGRRAWYFNSRMTDPGPLAATIIQVDPDGLVNLLVTHRSGRQQPETRLRLLQEGDDVTPAHFCCRPGLESVEVDVPEVPEVPATAEAATVPAVPATTKFVLRAIEGFETSEPNDIVRGIFRRIGAIEERFAALEAGDDVNTTTQGESDADA